jgi:hypothetical protein
MLQVDFNILNQKGTPAFFADALANRPAAGFVGRIFVDTDNPSTGMYRDTGTGWINVTGGATTPNLQAVCNVGSTTSTNMAVGNMPTGGNFQVLDVTNNTIYTTYGLAPNTAIQAVKSQIFNAGSVLISGPAFSSINGVQAIGVQVAVLNVPSGVSNFGAGYFTTQYDLAGNQINVGQSGSGRSVSELRTQTTFAGVGGGSITHSSGIYIGQCYQPAGIGTTINNRYGLFIQDQSEVFVGTLLSRWAIYQSGTSDGNYFAGYTTIGQVIFEAGVKLRVNGGSLKTIGAGTTSATNTFEALNSSGTTGFVVLDNGNCGVRVAAPTARMHIATGGATTASLGLKVRNSSDTIDVLSTFGTTQVIINSTSGSLQTSAQLQIDSTTRGVLLPRMTTAEINAIATPAEGLLVYNTTISHLCCYQAGAWVKFSHSPM